MSKEDTSALDESIGEDSELEVSCMLQDLKEKVEVFKGDMEARATEDDIVDEVESKMVIGDIMSDYGAEHKESKQADNFGADRANKELAAMQGKIGDLLANLQDAAAKVHFLCDFLAFVFTQCSFHVG
jgi:hypothetical protein